MTAERPLIGCEWHDGDDIDACGCPALDSPGAIAYRGLLVKARAEIARLTAELAAARAVPADVHGAMLDVEAAADRRSGFVAACNRLSATIARAIAEARQPSTVGGLLATAREGEIVEFDEGSWWMQITVFGGIVRWRVHDADADGWHPYIDDPSSWHCDEFVAFWLAKPARLVPASEADADPSTRGPLPQMGG